jgi:hypothetical protein
MEQDLSYNFGKVAIANTSNPTNEDHFHFINKNSTEKQKNANDMEINMMRFDDRNVPAIREGIMFIAGSQFDEMQNKNKNAEREIAELKRKLEIYKKQKHTIAQLVMTNKKTQFLQ